MSCGWDICFKLHFPSCLLNHRKTQGLDQTHRWILIPDFLPQHGARVLWARLLHSSLSSCTCLTVRDWDTHTHTHTPLHTQTLFKALFFCFFVLLFFLLVFSYSIFIFMHATPGGCSFTWVYWNISALPQHEAKHYEWLPVCLAIVPLTSLRRLQASVTLGSFLYTRTYTHIAVNTTLKAIAAHTRTHTQSPL